MTKFISKFIPENTVASAIEFGLLAALITVVSISAVTALGVKLSYQAEIAPPVNSK